MFLNFYWNYIVKDHQECYNLYVAAPRLVQKGGVLHGSICYIFSHCRGWCSLPLHYQMVGQRQKIVGNQPMALSPAIAKNGNRKAPVFQHRGFLFVVLHGLFVTFFA